MTIVLRVISHETGRRVMKHLKYGMNDIALPKGAHIEVVDETGRHLLRPTSADHVHGKLILGYRDGDATIQLRVSGELVDKLDADGALDLTAVNAAFDTSAASGAADGDARNDGAGIGNDSSEDNSGSDSGHHHGMSSALLILLGLGAAGGLAAGLAGGHSGSAPATPAAPSAPVVALGSGVADGANAAEATQAGGVVTVNAVSGTRIDVTFTNGANSVTKTVSGTGSPVAVALAAGDLQTLGDGFISVSAVAKANGQSSGAAASSFTLDTAAPATPVLALSSDTGTSASDHVTSNGSVSVTAENGSSVAITFTNGGHILTKIVTGTGAAQTVTLTSGDMATLGDGAVSVSAVATDAVGNASGTGALAFTLDTQTAVTISAQPILVGGSPVLTGTAEAGAAVSLTIGGATYHATAAGNGAWSVDTATATPFSGTLALNANGTNAVAAQGSDLAGNTASASQTVQMVSASSGVVDSSATSVAVQVNSLGPNVPVTINAPNATSLTVTGNTGGSPIDIAVKDLTPGVTDTYALKLVTNVTPSSNPAIPNLLILDFADAHDRVVLDPTSSIQGFNQIEVRNGTLDLSGVSLAGVVNIQINSGVVLTLAQFEALSSLVSLSGLGQLTIHLDTASQLSDLTSFLQSPGNLFLMGTTVTVEVGPSNTVISDGTLSSLVAALDYPSIPQISNAIGALQTAVGGNTAGIALLINDAASHGGTATTASITGIQAALSALQNQVAQQQLDLNAIQAHNLDSLQTLVTNLSNAMTALTAQVNVQGTQIAANTGDIAAQGTQIAGLLSSVGALQTSIAALQASSGGNAAAIAALQTAEASLSATVSALQTTVQNDIATLQGTNYATATYQTIADLSAKAVSLDAALTALQGVVSANDAAQTAALAQAQATLGAQITALANTVTSDVAALQGTNYATATYQTIADLSAKAVSLDAALTALQGVVSANDAAQTAALAQAQATLGAQITALADTVGTDIAALQGANFASATYQDIASISAALTALQALVGSTSVSSQISAAITAASGDFSALVNALHGAGIVLTVADAEALLVSDPAQLLTNYRLVDSYANLSVAAQNPADAAVFADAKTIGFTSASALTVVQVTTLENAIAAIQNAAPVSASLSQYGLSDSVAHLAAANPSVLAGASDIAATVGAAPFDQITSVLNAANQGDTTLDAVSGTPTQLLALPIGANDTITAITVTGVATAQQAAELEHLTVTAKAGSVQLGAVSDTAANIEAVIANEGGAGFLASASRIDVTGTLTVAEAEALQAVNAHVHIAMVTDSAASIAAALAGSQLSLTYVLSLATTDNATIAEAGVLQTALPGHVTIPGITDTSSNIGAAVAGGTLSLVGVGSVTISDASIADYATAAQAVALSHSSLALDYDVADTSAHYAATIAGSGQAFLAKADNVVLTGTASIAVARSLLGAHNSGTVSIDTINATAAQVTSLNFDAHDLVGQLNVAGLTFGNQTVDLTNVPFSTNLTYNGAALGNAYSLTIYLPQPDGVNLDGDGVDQAGQVVVHGGAGDNTIILTDDLPDGTFAPTAYASGSAIDYATYGNDQHGTETLVVIGSVDISNIALNGDINSYDLQALNGSPSTVTLSASQLNKLHNFTGASGGTVINITNAPDPVSGTVVVTSLANNQLTQNINFTNIIGVNIGINDNLQIDFLRLLGLSHVSTAAASGGSQSGLVTPIFDTTGGHTYLTTDGTQNGTPIAAGYLTSSSFNIDMSAAVGLSLGNDGSGHYFLQDTQGNHLNLPQTLNGNTLGLSADELTGSGAPLVIGAINGGVLRVDGLINSSGDAVDVTQVTAPITLAIGQNTDLTAANNPAQITADLAHITAIPGSSITVNNTGNANPPITLTLSADQASHVLISGTGEVRVTGTASANEDYSGLTATTIDLSGVNPNGHGVTLPATVPAGHTLILNQAEANGLTLGGSGAVGIVLNSGATMDLSHFDTAHLSVSLYVPNGMTATMPAGSNLAGFPIVVQGGGTLNIDGDVASGKSISGAGTVNVIGTGTVQGGDDFSHITAHTVDLSGYTGAVAHLSTLSSGGVAALVLNETEANFAASAAGNNLAVPSGTSLTVVVSGPASAPGGTLDLTGIHTQGTGTLAVHVTGDTVLVSAALNGAPISVDAAVSLTMPVAAADGLHVGGLGTVDLTGGGAVSADLTQITTAHVNWDVDTDTTFSGSLGSAVVTVEHDVVLSGAAAKFDGAVVLAGAANAGLGQSRGVLAVTGGFTTQDLSQVSASIDLSHASSGTITDLTLPTWVAGQALILSYAQTNGLMLDLGAGDARIVDIASNAGSDLSTVTSTSGHVIAVIDADATFTGTFSSAGNASIHFVIAGDTAHTLSLDAARLDARTVDGTGTVNVTSLSTDADLSHVAPSTLDFSNDGALVTAMGALTEGGHAITLPTLTAGHTIAVTMAEASGLGIAGVGGTVDIKGDVAADTNLFGIDAGIAVSFADANDPDGGAQTIIANGKTLVMASDQLTGQAIKVDTANLASGTLIVQGRGGTGTALTSAADLGGVAATIDLTGVTGLHVAGGLLEDQTTAAYALTLPSLVVTQTLLVKADQLADGTLALAGSGTLDVRGDVALASVNLSGVADSVHLSLLDGNDNAISVGNGLSLTLKAIHASGQTVTGSGAVVVVDDSTHAATVVSDLTNVLAATIDLTGFAGLHVDGGASADHLVDATGTLALILPTLGNGQTLELTLAELDGGLPLVVRGSGTVALTGMLDGETVNLTGIAAGNAVVFDNGTLVMDHGGRLTATSGQIDGQVITANDAASTVALADAAAAPVLTAAVVSDALAANAHAAIVGNVVDTAANLATLDWTNAGFLNSVHGTVTATTAATLAETEVLYAINYSRPGMATFSVEDTLTHFNAAPQNVVEQAVERASVNGGTITVSDPVTVADAAQLVAYNLEFQANNQQQIDGQDWNGIRFDVTDSAADLVALGSGAATNLNSALTFGGGSISVTGPATAAQASALSGEFGGLVAYSLADTAAAIVARHAADGNWVFLSGATSADVTGATSVADAVTIEGAGLGTVAIDLVSGGASAIATAIGAHAHFLDAIEGVSLTSAVAASTLNGGAPQSVDAVSDTVANLLGLNGFNYSRLTAGAVISATDTATAAQASTILANFFNSWTGGGSLPNATTEKTHLLLSIADTAAHVVGMNPAELSRLSGAVHVTDAASATQAVELAWQVANSGAHIVYSVADTAANLASELTGATAATVTGSITATSAATVGQAYALYQLATANGVTAGVHFTLSDTAANVAAAVTAHGAGFLVQPSGIVVTDAVTVAQASAILAAAGQGASVSFAALVDTAAQVNGAGAALLGHVSGTVTATLNAGSTDLSGVGANIDLRGMATQGVALDVGSSANTIVINQTVAQGAGTTMREAYDVLLPTLAATQTLTVDAAELAGGLAAAVAGSGHLVVAGDIAVDTDLTGVAGTIDVSFKDGGESGAFGTVALAAAAHLVAHDGQISGHAVTGAGTLVVMGDGNGDLTVDLDLGQVSANIDLTHPSLVIDGNGQLADDGHVITLPELTGQTVSLAVTDLLTGHLAITGSGTLDLQGDLQTSLDLTYLPSTIALSFLDGQDAGGLATIDVSGTSIAPVTLTMTAQEASGEAITGNQYATIDLAYAPGASTNLSASTDLAHVASTDFTTAAAWASALQGMNGGLAGQIAATDNGVALTGGNSDGALETFNYTATATGTYTFTANFQNNYRGSYTYTDSYGLHTYNPDNDRYISFTNVNGGGNQVYGWQSASGATTYTVSMVAGETLTVQLYTPGGRTAGPDGALTAPSVLTLSDGGFSTVNGTPATLNVDVGQSTDLSSAADPLAYVPVDQFTLANSAVLTMTGLEASGHTVAGAGSVVIAGDITSGWVDLTSVAVPMSFANGLSDDQPLHVNGDNWLRLTSAQANGQFISGGTVNVGGDIADGADALIDLTHVTSTLSFEDTATIARDVGAFNALTTATTINRNELDTLTYAPGGGYGQLYVGSGDKLVLRTDQAHWHSVSGPGTTYVVGDVNGSDLSLLGVTSNLSFWDGIVANPLNGNGEEDPLATGKGSITLNNQSTMEAIGNQLDGNTVLGDGSNVVRLYGALGDGSHAIDLSHITTSIDLAYAYDHNFTLVTGLGSQGNVLTNNGSIVVGFNALTGGQKTTIAGSISGTYNTLSADLPVTWNPDQTVTLYSRDATDLLLDTRDYSNGSLVLDEGGNAVGAKVLIAHVEDLLSQGVINGDFSQINASLVTLNFGGRQGGVLAYSGTFGAATVLIDDGVNVVMDGAVASGVTFDTQYNWAGRWNGDGFGVVGIDTLTANADLTRTVNDPVSFNLTLPNIHGHVDIDLSYGAAGSTYLPNGASAITWDAARHAFTNGTYAITLPSFDGSNGLIVEAGQLSGGTGFTLDGAGFVGVEGNIAANLDLTALNAAFATYFGQSATAIRTLAHGQNYPAGWDNWSAYGGTAVNSGVTLTLRPDQVYNNINVSGAGTLALASGATAYEDETGDIDLISVTADIDLTGLGADASSGGIVQDGTRDGTVVNFREGNSWINYTAGYTLGNGNYELLLPTLGAAQTLTVLADQLSGANGFNLSGTVSGQNRSLLDIAGTVGTQISLLSVADTVAVSFKDGNETGLGRTTVTASGQLSARIDQLDGQTIDGSGTVQAGVTGTVPQVSVADTSALQHLASGHTADLSAISANLDLTALSTTQTFAGLAINQSGQFADGTDATKLVDLPDLVAGQTLTVTAREMGGHLVLGEAAQNGGGTIDIQGDVTNTTGAVDLTGVEDGITVSFADNANANVVLSGSSAQLALKGAQASGLTVAGDGSSAVAYNNAGTSGSHFTGAALVIADNDTGTLSTLGTANSATVDLTNVTADLDLTQLSGLGVDSNGALSDGHGKLAIATSGSSAKPLLAQQTVKVTAAQLASLTNGATGRVILNGQTGSVVDVRGNLGAGASVDLTGIVGSTVSFVDTVDVSANAIAVAGTLTMLAEQFDAAGGMKINGTGALWLDATQATTTVNWVDSAQTPSYAISNTNLASTLDVQASTTLVGGGGGLMPSTMQIKVEDGKQLTSGYGYASGRTVYDAGHQYSYDAQTGTYAVTGGTLAVTGSSSGALDLSQVTLGTLDLTQFNGTSFTGLWSDLTDHALLLNDTQADGHGFTADGDGGALTVYGTAPTVYHDFSGVDVSVNSRLVASSAADMADAISGNAHTLLNVFSHVDLAFSSGLLTVSADQVSGMTADRFTGTGGLYVRDDSGTYHHGAETLYGSNNADTFVGGGYADALDLGGTGTAAGGSDTVAFSTVAGTAGHGLDFTISDFTTGGGAGHDVLNFSALTAHTAHGGAGTIEAVSLGAVPTTLGEEVIAVYDSFGADASGVASVFGAGSNLLNKALAAGGNTDAVFIVALADPNDSGSGAPAVNFGVWHWHEANGANGFVHAAELTEIGVLHGLTQTQIAAMTSANVIG